MKNVMIISSTPRRGGNSEVLANEFAKGAIEAGNEVEIVTLRDYHLNYCVACYSCTETGKCIIGDGMNEIAERLVKADVIVFATPVYFYCMSGQLKVFIDRLVPTYTKVKADIYLIATQMDDDAKKIDSVFESIRGCTRDCFENCEEKGVLYGAGLEEVGDASKYKGYMRDAYEMGKNC